MVTLNSKLTPRERQVAARLVRHKTNKEIAEDLCISKYTADSHVRNIRKKLEVCRKPRSLVVEILRDMGCVVPDHW